MLLKNKLKRLFLALITVTGLSLCGGAGADQEGLIPLDIRDFVSDPDFIFRGEVTSVAYKDAEMTPVIDPTTGQQAMEEGIPVFQDGSGLPHTFVTLQVEHVYKGSLQAGGPQELTLRHVGGHSQAEPNIVEWVDIFPLFDVGDRSVLFVHGNTAGPFPLHQNRNGRFRIINGMMYNDYGQRILHIQNAPPLPQEADFGPSDILSDIHVNQIGPATIGRDIVIPEGEHGPGGQPQEPNSPNPSAVHFTEAAFDVFLSAIVAEIYPTGPPQTVVMSANINDTIIPDPLVDLAFPPIPPEPPEPRPWFDNLTPEEQEEVLEEDRLEAELVALTGGDPVVPDPTSPNFDCEIEILQFGPLPADISGPEDKPDCRVDMFDLRMMAFLWLLCNDPSDPTCIILDL